MCYAYSWLPMITRPTQKTATWIDNIFTNNVLKEDYYTNGVLLCDITDHFPVYHITNKVIQTKETVCIHQRKMNDSCKQQFLNSLSTCEWKHVMETNDAQEAYSKFSETYQAIYDKCFPKYVTKRRYDNKLPWLSEALRKPINHQNKLYKKEKKMHWQSRNWITKIWGNIKIFNEKRWKETLTRYLLEVQR